MKTFLTALVIGACGALAITVSFAAGWPAWVMFLAWVSYYLFGRTLRSSGRTFLQILAGIVMGIGISTVAGFLSPVLGPSGFPLTVFVLIGSLAYLSKIRGMDNVPALFLGLIIFFGSHPAIAPVPIFQLLLPIVGGFAFAMLNDYGIKKIHNSKTVNNNYQDEHTS